MNLKKLVKKAMKGNGDAFEKLLEIHGERLYRTAYLYVRNREDALDVVQETAFKAFSSIGNLRNQEYFLTWLTKILIHCAYDVLELKKKEMPVEYLLEHSSDPVPSKDSQMDLAEALSHLKKDYRTAVLLFYYQDLPIKEIAKIMNIPENTVKTYLYRAKKCLKSLLGGTEGYGKEIV